MMHMECLFSLRALQIHKHFLPYESSLFPKYGDR